MILPILIEDVLKICNLNANIDANGVFALHAPLILLDLKAWLTEAAYTAVTSENPGCTEADKIAYAYLLYARVLPLLNVVTTGGGLVKAITNRDNKSNELYSPAEARALANQFKLKALKLLESSLSDAGLAELADMGGSAVRGNRSWVI